MVLSLVLRASFELFELSQRSRDGRKNLQKKRQFMLCLLYQSANIIQVRAMRGDGGSPKSSVAMLTTQTQSYHRSCVGRITFGSN